MKKYVLLLVIFSIFMLSNVYALSCEPILKEKKSITFCQNGCDYSNIEDVIMDNNDGCTFNEITINVKDNGNYDFSSISFNPNRFYIIGEENSKAHILFNDNTSSVVALSNLIVEAESFGSILDLDFNNVEFTTGVELYSLGNIKIINSSFASFLGVKVGKQAIIDNINVDRYSFYLGNVFINNSKFADQVDIVGFGRFENSMINSRSKYGLLTRYNSFEDMNGGEKNNNSNMEDTLIIDNAIIHGASQYGICYKTIKGLYSNYIVSNSDITANKISFGVEVEQLDITDKKSVNVSHSYNAKLLNNSSVNYNVLIKNTKLDSVSSKGLENESIAPVIYIDDTNTWSNMINRTNIFDNMMNSTANVFEGEGGKVLIDLANKDEIVIDGSDYKRLNNYFKELENVDNSAINWTVVDSSIARVDKGMIIPLKAGETDIIASYNNNDYILHIKVKGNGTINNGLARHIVNPNTEDQIILIGILFVISLIIYIINRFKRRKNIESYL